MAKVIRNQWVFRKGNKWLRYLPRRKDGRMGEFDYAKQGATFEDFCASQAEASQAAPSKLWVSWLYRDLSGEPKWTKDRVQKLFGAEPTPGKMEVFPNTPAYNEELWNIKHLIELRPITFPNGEPTKVDVHALELKPDGSCVVAEKLAVSEEQLRLFDEQKQHTDKELSSQLNRRYYGFKDIFERNVYTPSNISIMK